MGKLDGKVALITGAGSGMGRASAVLFAHEGAKVSVVDLTPAGGKQTVQMIKEAGGEGIFIQADVSKADEVRRMVKITAETYGRIDILFNNAGVLGLQAATSDLSEEDWDHILNVNLKSVFLGMKYTIPIMLNQGGGVIINTSSRQGLVVTPNSAAYNVSKAGVIQLTKTTAIEYAAKNIRVNCICPGAIQTPMSEAWIPMLQTDFLLQARVGQPEEIARAALYLASDDSSYVTGHALVVDGGMTTWTKAIVKGE